MFRRRRFARRRIARRKITPRRFFRARKSLKIARQFVHSFVRTTVLTDLDSVTPGNNTVSSLVTTFSTINGAAEFGALYKFFRINATKWTFFCDQPNAQTGQAGVTAPQFTSVVNRDISGPTAPSTESDLLQFRSAKTKTLTNGIKHTVYVKYPTMDVQSTALPSPMSKQWYPTYATGAALNPTQFDGVTFLFKGLDIETNIRVYRKDYLQFKGMY